MKVARQGFRVLPYFLLLLALLGGGLLLPRLLNTFNTLSSGIRNTFIQYLNSVSSYQIRYKSIAPSLVGSLRISGLEVRRSDASVIFSADTLDLAYDFWGLVSMKGLSALSQVRLEGYFFDIDLDRDLTSPKSGTQTESQDIDTLLSLVLGMFDKNLSLYFARGRGQVRTSGLVFETNLRQVQLNLNNGDIQFESKKIELVSAIPGFGPVETEVELSASWAGSAALLFGTVRTARVYSDYGTLAPQGFSFSFNPTEFRVERIPDALPLDLLMNLNRKSGIMQLDLGLQTLLPARFFTPNKELQNLYGTYLSKPLDLSLGARVDTKTRQIDWQGTLSTNQNLPYLGLTSIALAAKGSDMSLNLTEFNIVSEKGYASATGSLGFDVLGAGLDVSANMELPDGLGWLELAGAVQANLKSLELNNFTLNWQGQSLGLTQAKLDFKTLAYEAELLLGSNTGGELRADLAGIAKIGAVQETSVEVIDYAIFAKDSPLWLFLPSFDLPAPFSPSDRLSARIKARGAGLEDLELALSDANYISQSGLASLELNGSYGGRQINIDSLFLRYDAYELNLRGVAAENLGDWTFLGTQTFMGNNFESRLRLASDFSSLDIQLSLGIGAQVSLKNQVLQGYWNVDSLPISQFWPASEGRARGSFEYELKTNTWNFGISALSILAKGLMPAYPDMWSNLELKAQLNSKELNITSLEYVDPLGSLSGTASFLGIFEGPRELNLNLVGPKRSKDVLEEALTLQLAIHDEEKLDGNYDLQGLNLSRLGVKGLAGSIDISGAVGGSISSPQLDARYSIVQGLLDKDNFSLSGEADFKNQELNLQKLTLGIIDHKINIVSANYSFIRNTLRTHVRYSSGLIAAEKPLDLQLFLPLNENATEEAQLELLGLPLGPEIESGLSFRGSKHKRGWTWTEVSETLQIYHDFEGSFTIRANSPFPFSGYAEGRLGPGTIDLGVSGFSINLEQYSKYLDMGFIAVLRGKLGGELRLAGSLADPSLYGRLIIDDFQSRVALHPGILEAKKIQLILDDKEIIVAPFTLQSDKTKIDVDGSFFLSRLGLGDFSLGLLIGSGEGLRVEAIYGPLEIDGRASGKVRVRGNAQRIEVLADLVANETSLGIVSVNPSSASANEGPDLALVINVTSGRNVEFLWPNKRLPVLRGYLNSGQKVSVSLDTANESLLIKGDVSLRGGEMYYLERSFFIREATLRMNEENGAFNPILEARADARVALAAGVHKLIMNIDGDKLSELKPRISADPPLPAESLEVLITGGDPENPKAVDLGTLLYTGMDALSRFGLLKNFEDEARNFLGLDVFSLRSGLFPSLVQDAVEPLLNPLDNQSYSFGKYLDKTSILLGKVFGEDIYGELLAQLRASDENSASANALGIELGLEINMEWTTPFFNLDWSFTPKDASSLYLKDHTFTLFWDLK